VDMWLQHNKKINLEIALKTIDGLVIKPGETFSYWRSIGRPSAKKGYVEGMVLHYGKFKPGVGGGLCQLSNMIYWMVLHTPLTVVERHRHGFDCFPDSNRKLPFGSGATCVYNYRDLQVKNNSNESYRLDIKIVKDDLVGKIVSDVDQHLIYKVYESHAKMTQSHWGPYIRHNEIRRRILSKDQILLDDEYVCENHALMMYEPLLEYRSESVN